MTPQEAIRRITTHNEIHRRKEPNAVHITRALIMACNALAKQVKQRHSNKFYDDGSVEYICPACENALYDEQTYCDVCGQALCWEDAEKEDQE